MRATYTSRVRSRFHSVRFVHAQYSGADLTWKKRYFTLVGTHLRQYSRREDVQHGEEPTQWISILNCNLGLWPVADRSVFHINVIKQV